MAELTQLFPKVEAITSLPKPEEVVQQIETKIYPSVESEASLSAEPVNVLNSVGNKEVEQIIEEPDTRPKLLSLKEKILQEQNSEQVAPVDIDNQDPSWLDEFMYTFDSSENDITNLGIWAESKWPLGKLSIGMGGVDYLSPEELYGEGFKEASEDQRREMIRGAKIRDLKEEYPELSALGAESGSANFLGMAAKMITTPTSLLPVGKGLKGMAAMGAVMGAEFEAAAQLAEEGGINDLTSLGISTAVGAGASLGLGLLGNQASKLISRNKAARQNTDKVKEANQNYDIIYDEIVQIQALESIPPQKMAEVVGNRIGMTTDQVINTLQVSGKQLTVPTKQQAKTILDQTLPPVVGQSSGWDKTIGILSTSIAKYSQPLSQKLVRLEGRIAQKVYQDEQTVLPFIRAIKKQLPKEKIKILEVHLGHGNFKAAKELLNNNTEIGERALDVFDAKLTQKYEEAIGAGLKLENRANYFPLKVSDRAGIRKYLGSDPARVSELNKALSSRASQLGKKPTDLTVEESDLVFNRLITGSLNKGAKGTAGFMKQRVVSKLDEGAMEFYQSWDTALLGYFREVTRATETFNVLGAKNMVKKKDGTMFDVNESVGRLVAREVQSKRLSINDVAEKDFEELLKLAVSPPKTASGLVRNIQALTHMETIANVISSTSQFADLPHSFKNNGFAATFEAILNPRGYKQVDVGEILGDTLAAELGTIKNSSDFLQKSLDYVLESPLTLFKKIDRLTKGTYIRGSLNKASAMTRSEKGMKRLREDYSKAFGDEFLPLVQDLSSKTMTPRVKEFLFMKASDLYPTSKLETITSVAKQPNWRVATMLKTYTLKSVYDSVVRKGILDNVKKGRKDEAAKNLVYLVGVMSLAEASVMEIKDFILGRGFEAEEILTQDSWVDGMLRVAGFSRYVLDRFGSDGNPKMLAAEMLFPPFVLMSAMWQDGSKALDQDLSTENSNVLAKLPIVGRFYNEFMRKDSSGDTRSEREAEDRKDRDRDRERERRRRQRNAAFN